MSLRTQLRALSSLLVLLPIAGCSGTPEDRLDAIREIQAQGLVEDSIEPLAEMIEQGDRRGETLYRYGRALSVAGRPGRAVWALDAALEDPDWFVHASHQLAMNATQSQNHDLALSVLRRLREERADDPDADIPARLLEIRVLLATRRMYEEALDEAEALLDDHPDMEEAVRLKAVALIGLGETDEAYELIREADIMMAELPPTTPEVEEETFDDGDPLAGAAEATADEEGAAGEEETGGGDVARSAGDTYWCTVRASFKREAGELEEALGIVDECLAAAPADPGLLNEAMKIYGALGRYERILEVLQAAYDAQPEDGGLRNSLVDHLAAIGRRDEGEKVMREALERAQSAEPPQPIWTATIWVDLAGFLLESERVDEGIDAYEQALALLGDNASAELRFRFADALILAKRYDRAIEVIDSSPVEVYPPMIRGRVAFERGDFETAIRELDRAALLWPDNAPTRYYLARAAEGVGDLDRAVEEYRQALRSDPALLPARERLVRLHLAEGRVRDANTIHRFASPKKGGAASPSTELKVLAVEIQTRLGNEPDLSIPPNSSISVRKLQALVIEALSRGLEFRAGTDEAVASLRKLEQQVEPHTRDLFALAQVELLMKKEGAAERAVEVARRADTELPDHPIIHLALGRALVHAGVDLDEAERLLESVLEADPERADARASLADLARARGQLEQAVAGYDAVLATTPNHWQSVAGRAAALQALGRSDEARRTLESYLARDNPYDGNAAFELARLLDESARARRIELAERAIRFGAGPAALELLAQLDPEAAARDRAEIELELDPTPAKAPQAPAAAAEAQPSGA